jgi:hypothetical protein
MVMPPQTLDELVSKAPLIVISFCSHKIQMARAMVSTTVRGTGC